MQDSTVIQLKFSNSEIPEFKQRAGETYVRFGSDDSYPEYLLELFDKSSKHGAIINGKVDYIFGGGLELEAGGDPKAEAFLESISKIAEQTILDTELYGGYYWEIIPSAYEGVFGIYHISFENIRTNKDRSLFFYKEDWKDRAEEPKVYPAFNRNLKEPSIFAFKEYRPGKKRVYALPKYLPSCNYIEADIEVSKHTLTNSKTGFSGSKFINFYNGEPTPEGKKEISDKFKTKFSGSEGEKIVIAFNKPETKAPTIDDLGASDLTKEDFTRVNNQIAQEIFTGAQITHPLLFGIQQEGKLGGATELREAFEIFKNTYVTRKKEQFEKVANFFAGLKGIVTKLKLKAIEPIGFTFSEATMLQVAPKSWLLEKMGIDPLLYPDAPATGTAMAPVKSPEELANEAPVNATLRDLTAKQHQQLQRIIRQYSKGQLTKEAATILLKSGLGFTDEEVAGILGLDTEQAFSSAEDMELLFQAHGEPKESYEAVKSKAATFDTEDETFFMSYTFDKATAEETGLQPPTAAKAPPVKVKLPEFRIMYSYEVREGEGPELLPTSRSFCVKMVAFSKFYTRADIQKISGLLGYNVFDRVGGFWNDNGVIKKHCRHEWRANIVVKK